MLKRISSGLVLVLMTTSVAALEGGDKTDRVRIGPVFYSTPKNWKRQRPANQMRVVQFGVPLAEGDEGTCELVVFYFQGQGGTVEQNITRWKAMFQEIDGTPKIEEFKAGDLQITLVDITGSYKDKPFPMAETFTLRKNYRMMAAVVETPDDGPYYFRLVGPKKTVARDADAYTAMLKGAGKE